MQNLILVTVCIYSTTVFCYTLYRELTKAGTSHLKWEVEFFCYFLPIIRNHYEILLKKQKEEHNFLWDGYSDDDTKIGVYREVRIYNKGMKIKAGIK